MAGDVLLWGCLDAHYGGKLSPNCCSAAVFDISTEALLEIFSIMAAIYCSLRE
jgi:hypothetical protein